MKRLLKHLLKPEHSTLFLLVTTVLSSLIAIGVTWTFTGIPSEPPPGILQIEPTPGDACGPPPSPEDWKVIRDDATVDADAVYAFSAHIAEWDDCITEYSGAIKDFAFVLDGVRDSTIEAAGSYFKQFVDPDFGSPLEIPGPGLFEEHSPFEGDPDIMPWIFDNWTPRGS